MSTVLLLSSAARPRYREDILRCIAAPLEGIVQFRYQKEWMACASPECLKGKEGLICFMGNAYTGYQPLTPVRYVTIEHVSVHGTTVSLILKMGQFAFAETARFTDVVKEHANQYHPKKDNDGLLHGNWVFPADLSSSVVVRENSLATFEQLVKELASRPEFADEKVYWTVVGVEPIAKMSPDYSEMKPWPNALSRNSTNSLVLYHYSPSGDPQKPSSLSLSSGGSICGLTSTEIPIDSRYDLKRWRFSVQAPGFGPEPGWIGVSTPSGWGVELPVGAKQDWLKQVFFTLLITLSLSAPHIYPSQESAIIGSLLVALAVVFGIRKSV